MSMLPAGFEPTISAGERPKTYALDRVATGTGLFFLTEASKTVTHLPSSIMSSGIISSSENQYVVMFVDSTSLGYRALQSTDVRTSRGRIKCG